MSLKRQTIWSIAPLIVISVANIFSVPLFYRYLGTDMYALWFYVITFSGMFGFADLGLGVAVGRYIGIAIGKGDHAAVREYWGTGNLIVLPLLAVTGLLFALVGAVFGPVWFDKIAPDSVGLLRACFVAGGVSLFFGYYGQFWNILLQANLDFKFSSVSRIGTSLLLIVPAVALAWATRNPLWIILWNALVGLLQLGLLVWYSRRHFGLGFDLGAASRARAREMAAYTGKTFATLVAGSIFGSIDRLVLGRIAPNAADFDHYSICANVGTRLQGLGGAVMGPVFHNTNRVIEEGKKSSAAAIYNEMFNFTFGWYLLASVWIAAWHPVLLRLWLGSDLGMKVAPLFTPIIIACSLNAIAGISNSQLCSLNRVGTSLGFMIAAGVLAVVGVYIGWQFAGVVGVAYGYLGSRVALLVQDLYVIRLVNARGWLSGRTWLSIGIQNLIAGGFALTYLAFPRDSFWLLVPSALHGGLMAAWLLRQPFRHIAGGFAGWRRVRTTPAQKGAAGS